MHGKVVPIPATQETRVPLVMAPSRAGTHTHTHTGLQARPLDESFPFKATTTSNFRNDVKHLRPVLTAQWCSLCFTAVVATPKVSVGVASQTRVTLNENWVICDQPSY